MGGPGVGVGGPGVCVCVCVGGGGFRCSFSAKCGGLVNSAFVLETGTPSG